MNDRLRFGEKVITLREALIENTMYVTARDDKRLLDYERFAVQGYSRDKAIAKLRSRFKVARIAWSEQSDEEFAASWKQPRKDRLLP